MNKNLMDGSLYDLLVSSAEAGLGLQSDDGTMPPGHNGLYHDPETPVRNTAHWAMLFLKAFDISSDEPYKRAAIKAISYLESSEARPMGFTFWCRTNPKKDSCNGLIGQAWALEPFIYGAELLENKRWISFAEQIFLLHPFDQKRGLWMRVNVDGMHLPFDVTFNHQLWFAAVGAFLGKTSADIAGQVERFMEQLPTHLSIYSNGLIYHPLIFRYTLREKKSDLIRIILETKQRRKSIRYKAIGYHLFNMYAFSILHEVYPDHPFWNHPSFKKTVGYAFGKEFKNAIEHNEYGHPYNPPGIEMAYLVDRFGDRFPDTPDASAWVAGQMQRSFDPEKKLMVLGTEDTNTHAARLYEAVRVADIPLATSIYSQ